MRSDFEIENVPFSICAEMAFLMQSEMCLFRSTKTDHAFSIGRQIENIQHFRSGEQVENVNRKLLLVGVTRHSAQSSAHTQHQTPDRSTPTSELQTLLPSSRTRGGDGIVARLWHCCLRASKSRTCFLEPDLMSSSHIDNAAFNIGLSRGDFSMNERLHVRHRDLDVLLSWCSVVYVYCCVVWSVCVCGPILLRPRPALNLKGPSAPGV